MPHRARLTGMPPPRRWLRGETQRREPPMSLPSSAPEAVDARDASATAEPAAPPLRQRLAVGFATLRATVGWLYRSNPRAFLITAIGSLPEPLFFPAVLLTLHAFLQALSTPNGRVALSPGA